MKHPVEGLIDRDVAGQIPRLAIMTDTLDRCANYGTHLAIDCAKESQGQDVSSIILLGLHVTKMVDSISVLIAKSCVESAQVLLRSLIEATLALMYMEQGDHERKSRQYLVAHVHKRIELYEKFDPNTQAGKQMLGQGKGRSMTEMSDYVRFDTQSDITNLRGLLQQPEYAPIEVEWTRLKASRSTVWWYSLFGGPSTIEQLADSVKARDLYELLYRNQSGEVHATNVLSGVHLTKTSEQAFQPIRYPIQAPQTTSLTIVLAQLAFRSLIATLAPSQKAAYQNWYTRQILSPYKEISRIILEDGNREVRTPKAHK